MNYQGNVKCLQLYMLDRYILAQSTNMYKPLLFFLSFHLQLMQQPSRRLSSFIICYIFFLHFMYWIQLMLSLQLEQLYYPGYVIIALDVFVSRVIHSFPILYHLSICLFGLYLLSWSLWMYGKREKYGKVEWKDANQWFTHTQYTHTRTHK